MSISVDLARKVLEACKHRARELRSPISIAIMDAGGHLVLFERMMAPYGWATTNISLAKAHTSVMFNQSTDSVAQWASAIPGFSASLAAMTDGKFIMAAGGWPIRVNGVTIGGIGISGGNAPGRDDEIARAGLAVVEAQPHPQQPPVTYYQPPHPQPLSPAYHQPAQGYASGVHGGAEPPYAPVHQPVPAPPNGQNYAAEQPSRVSEKVEQQGGPRNLAPNDIHPYSDTYTEDTSSSSSADRSGDRSS